jgi:anaerobic magnesium-protoporphyrin IX monomethyl ester cyclase
LRTFPPVMAKTIPVKHYRVVLINPPSPYLANDAAYPPTGLMYIGAVLEKAGHDVAIIDLSGNPDWESVVSTLEGDLFGITCVTPNFNLVRKISFLLPPDRPIIVGGVHPTFLPEETLEKIRCDAVVQGEGEVAILEVIEDLRRRALKRKYEGGIVPVQAIPKPSRHLVDLRRYQPGGELTTPIYTSRGCPYRCHFCSKITESKFRVLPLQHILGEIEETMTYGYRHLVFGDDNAAIRPGRLKELLQSIIPLGISFRLNQDARRVDEEILSLAKKAGCKEISFGIESGSQKMLDVMNKRTTVERSKSAILKVREQGLKVKAYFMVNFPGETEQTVEETLRFVEDTQPDKWLLSSFAPLPGSDTFQSPEKYGITWMSSNWEDYYLVGKGGSFQPCFETEELTRERQVILHGLLYRGLQERLN